MAKLLIIQHGLKWPSNLVIALTIRLQENCMLKAIAAGTRQKIACHDIDDILLGLRAELELISLLQPLY